MRFSEMLPSIQNVSLGTVPACCYPWIPDQGDGTFCNPILHADYSDPDVIRVGADFYMTASSFNCTPGLPILHSRDLVNWTLLHHAVRNLPHPRYNEVQPGCGIWAPALRFHAGRFWIFFPTPDEGIYLTTADHPAGPWSEPLLVQEGKGLIDPCPLWDDDGRAYLVHAYAHSRSGIKHQLRVRPMAPDGSRLLGEGRIVFHDPERHPTLEGPKFLKRDGWYYILAPAGGVATGWQVALRSRDIYGPYEDKIVLAQGRSSVNGPHQGALVDTPGGDAWFVHFQDVGVYGRITHLQPVHWEQGWPRMGSQGEPVQRHARPQIAPVQKIGAPQTSDEFDSASLGLQWQWQANHREAWWSLTDRPGWLRLFPQPAADSLERQPNLLLQKFPARTFRVETDLDWSPGRPGEEAGLIVSGVPSASLGLHRTASGNRLILQINGQEVFGCDINGDRIRLRVEIQDGGACHWSYATTGGFIPLPQPFQARPGVWIGAKVGLYTRQSGGAAGSGFADFGYFRFLARDG